MGSFRGGTFDEASYSHFARQYHVLIEGGVCQLSFAYAASHPKLAGPELCMFPYKFAHI